MALSVGIVGLPNVGKSTVFNALTAGKQLVCFVNPDDPAEMVINL